MHMPGRSRTAPRYGGTALLTALALLTVLTLLGTFGMQQARLEHRMAGNARFRIGALANAEYVLAVAEADIDALNGDPFNPNRPGDHYYPQDMHDLDPAVPGVQRPADRVWTFGSAYVSLPDIDGDGSDSDGDGIADDGTGRYVIQDAGRELVLSGPPPAAGTPAALNAVPVQAFLVTARSRSAGGSQRTVQSVYRRAPLATSGAVAAGIAAGPVAATPVRAYGRHGWIDLRE
jgi:hypothetical protein